MKIIKSIVLLVVILAASSAQGEIKTLDFSSGENSFEVFEKAGVELKPFKGIRYLRTVDAGFYRIMLPGNVEYLLEVERGEVRNHLDKEGYANIVKLVTNRLSLEAAKKLSYTFHRQFGLDVKELDAWFDQLEAGEAYSMYGKGYNANFPGMGISLRTTFDKEQPAFIIFNFNWDERAAKKINRSLENNKVLDVSFDMPELLEGVPEFTEVPEVEPVIVKANDSQPFVAETPKPEPAIKDPTEVKTPEQTDEPAETSPNWWLWLIGAVIVVIGVVLVVRRKKMNLHANQ